MASLVHRLSSGDASVFEDLKCDGSFGLKMPKLRDICASLAHMPPRDLMPRVLCELPSFLFLYKPPHWLCRVSTSPKDVASDIRHPSMYPKLLLSRYASLKLPLRPEVNDPAHQYGLCNRLDDQTSGIVMIAKTDAAFRSLRHAINAKTTTKVYIALVHGVIPPATTTGAIKRDICCHEPMPMMASCSTVREGPDAQCRAAHSHFLVLERLANATVVAVRIFTGVTHQIRVHMKSLGFPLVGDAKYSDSKSSDSGTTLGPGRLFLHATYYAVRDAAGHHSHACVCPLPADLTGCLARLGARGDYETETSLRGLLQPLLRLTTPSAEMKSIKPRPSSSTSTSTSTSSSTSSSTSTSTRKPRPSSSTSTSSRKPRPSSSTSTSSRKPRPSSSTSTSSRKPRPSSSTSTSSRKPRPSSSKQGKRS